MPGSGMRLSPHTWGLLLGAPMFSEVGLAPTEKAQRAMDALAPNAKANPPITSRRTMEQLYDRPLPRGRDSEARRGASRGGRRNPPRGSHSVQGKHARLPAAPVLSVAPGRRKIPPVRHLLLSLVPDSSHLARCAFPPPRILAVTHACPTVHFGRIDVVGSPPTSPFSLIHAEFSAPLRH